MSASGRVVVCGSLHYDIAVETPGWPTAGETAVGTSWFPKLGGKGRNQAVAARRAGAETIMIGRVGADDFGRELLADLDRRGIDRSAVTVSATAGTGMSVALFDPAGDYRAIIVSGSNLELGPAIIANDAQLSRAGVLVLQNEIPDEANTAMAGATRAAGATVILNAAPARPLSTALAARVDILVVNAIEAAQLAGISEPRDLESAAAAARSLAEGFPQAVVTAGAAGVASAGRLGAMRFPAEPVKVISTHGAGDEFVGCLAAELAAGGGLERALALANRAAARLISTPEAARG